MQASVDPDEPSDLRALFSTAARRQNYLDVEAALALAEAELGIIPAEAGQRIAAAAHLELLDVDRIDAEQETTGHLMVPLVAALARQVGEPYGGWVHWGATTQNIQQTGDVLAIRTAHAELVARVRALLSGLADLGERSADLVMPGRTHWQQAVPITFGFKVAAWSDVMLRHLDRLESLAPRLLTSMTGGAAGTFATFGALGPQVQAGVARRLGLTPMAVPNRSIVDHFAELVCVLGMVDATAAAIAEEISRLMATEFGEVAEPIPDGDVGSSTMPQKRNSKLCGRVVILSAESRALVPLALDAMIQSHEVDGTRSAMMDHAVTQSCVLTGDALTSLTRVVDGLELFGDRMERNLALTDGLISAEAVMMELAQVLGRQQAHEVVHHAATVTATTPGARFVDVLAADPQISARLDGDTLTRLVDPRRHVGLSAELARETSARVRRRLTGDPGEREGAMAESFEDFMTRREAASNDYIAGDATALQTMLTHADPASFMPPSGAVVAGAAAVEEAQVGGAAAFGPKSTGHFDVVSSGSSGDLAFWTGRQVASMDVRGQDEPMDMVLRTTEVFRREDGEWKLVHRHADTTPPPGG